MILLHSHLVYGKDARPKGSYFNLEKAICNNHQVQVSNNKTSPPHITNIFFRMCISLVARDEDLHCFDFLFAARCRFSGKPRDGYVFKRPLVIGEMIKHGEKITYDCFASYTMEGSSTQECDNGRWTNDVPKCKGL